MEMEEERYTNGIFYCAFFQKFSASERERETDPAYSEEMELQ